MIAVEDNGRLGGMQPGERGEDTLVNRRLTGQGDRVMKGLQPRL
jgi:hypothetical protein